MCGVRPAAGPRHGSAGTPDRQAHMLLMRHVVEQLGLDQPPYERGYRDLALHAG